ncbi:MAG TPA: quinoprotein dehydrogenase-associated putative ABC transporter substrate-binding protein, partial [Vicinamibacterales bacterium]|nr:quinoprotein dehydrogenase-associated putative ABC transporter substrate-binding protein [Vicinamibacterales bacterium]
NGRGEGFENRIAQLVARDLHETVQYRWMPQRRGFIRTLKAGECDLVIGVPSGYDMVLATTPYYRSTYVFVSAKRRNLGLHSFDDPILRSLKIGIHASAEDGFNQPPAHALARRGIVGNIVGFKMMDVETVRNPQGRVIDAVASGNIDVAIVWGPFGGYFAKRQRVPLEVTPVSPAIDPPSLPFAFDISMGVRKGEVDFKKQLESILERRRSQIRKILDDYGVPIVNAIDQ